MTPQDFVAKWRNTTLKERAASQEHFLDLCRLVGHPTPAEDDPTGERFTFEAGADKQSGGQGWADVWKRRAFAWEYKGKHANLDAAYQQLLQYRESLENPPLLIVSDMDTIVIHTNFTNTVKRKVAIGFEDLLIADGMRHLRNIFYEPEAFRSTQTAEQVTEEAAQEFARLAAHLRRQEDSPEHIAHFLIRLLFCLFAEDIDLLPRTLFTRLVDAGRGHADGFNRQLRQLFHAMAVGDFFGEHTIRHFDGGLFDDAGAMDLDRDGLEIVHHVSRLDWSSIEPSIFGTLFERGLDPGKRSQLGAHYTSRDDIMLIVEPVLMAPLRREWVEIQVQARELAGKRDAAPTQGVRTRHHNDLERLLGAFAQRLATVRVLDPACGSGNFLYVALKLLLDLWKAARIFAGEMGLSLPAPLPGFAPSPEQLYGIEINAYAHELAQATVWIGYIQWLHENGFGAPSEPILKPLDNIKHMDAILAYDKDGKPMEPQWPEAEIIVGNPPFLGWYKLRHELGDTYVNALFRLYDSRVPGGADLVTYWFEHTRAFIERGVVQRAGLLATNSIRGGANREILDRIKATGDIFMAWSNRPWILDGAAVRVSMIGFDNGHEDQRSLDGNPINSISADLTGGLDLTVAAQLVENRDICFLGAFKFGLFDIPSDRAEELLQEPLNLNGRPNSDVIRPWVNGWDITRRSRGMWIIDFGSLSEEKASEYEAPFEYVRKVVKPERDKNRRKRRRIYWWQHGELSPGLYNAIDPLPRYIGSPRVAKHRLFVWLSHPTIPDMQVIVFARSDNYFFGVLHSKPHELWSLRQGTSLEDRPRYTPTTTFETFPFPWPPGHEPQDDPRVHAIAAAVKDLNEKREAWLNREPSGRGLGEKELKKRTLTNLYNQRPTWLDLLHKKLDAAVFDAYGWPHDLSDEEILERLLALNLERASEEIT